MQKFDWFSAAMGLTIVGAIWGVAALLIEYSLEIVMGGTDVSWWLCLLLVPFSGGLAVPVAIIVTILSAGGVFG